MMNDRVQHPQLSLSARKEEQLLVDMLVNPSPYDFFKLYVTDFSWHTVCGVAQ